MREKKVREASGDVAGLVILWKRKIGKQGGWQRAQHEGIGLGCLTYQAVVKYKLCFCFDRQNNNLGGR